MAYFTVRDDRFRLALAEKFVNRHQTQRPEGGDGNWKQLGHFRQKTIPIQAFYILFLLFCALFSLHFVCICPSFCLLLLLLLSFYCQSVLFIIITGGPWPAMMGFPLWQPPIPLDYGCCLLFHWYGKETFCSVQFISQGAKLLCTRPISWSDVGALINYCSRPSLIVSRCFSLLFVARDKELVTSFLTRATKSGEKQRPWKTVNVEL